MDGFINLYKEKGWTSNDCVQKLRGILHTKKVGHGGTLDPEVTGVLPIAVGKATRLLEYMEAAGKTYEGEITLGFSTETEDAQGSLVEKKDISENILSIKQVDTAMSRFLGRIEQMPPMYSAVKIKGKRLYEYARAGQVIERPSRQVEIRTFKRTSPLNFHDARLSFSFEVSCSKGTYIRTLCVDLARQLGFPGHMSGLTRIMANGLRIETAKNLQEVEDIYKKGEILSFLCPLAIAVSDLRKIELTLEQFEEVSHGKSLEMRGFQENEKVALFYENNLLAIYESRENGLKAKKVLL